VKCRVLAMGNTHNQMFSSVLNQGKHGKEFLMEIDYLD
jgi:hypothetical protein